MKKIEIPKKATASLLRALMSEAPIRNKQDILKDLGLLHKSGKVYGRVIGDSSWNGGFDPFSNRIKVHLLYHNADKELEVYEDSFNPFELKRITKNSIKYYKSKKDAKTNTGVDQITL